MDGSSPDLLSNLLHRQRAAHARRVPDYSQRIDDLKRLRAVVKRRSEEIVTAIAADFGRRSRHETLLSDVMTVLHDIDYAVSKLRRWMKPKRVPTSLQFQPARSEIRYQPVGVVGIISPWNYPVNLALMPLAAAIAAGNHVMLKPSELTPRTSDLLKSLLADVFPEERVAVVLGRMPKGQVRAYGEVDLILATSEAVAERALLENPHVATKIVRFPNPIDWALHQRASRQTLAKAPFEIGYVGRIHPEKGLEQFLEAGCRLLPRTDLPAWRISLTGPVSVVQGGGGEAYRDGLLARYGGSLGDRLQIHAPVFNPVELARIYGGFEIFCYPSRAAKGEGLSIAPLEAMAAGAVPLVSQLACYRDVIVHDHNGLTFDQEGPDAAGRIAESIAGLLEDPGRRQRLSRTAQSDVRRYDYAEATRQLLQAFARLTGKSDKP